jgi:3-hydroxyacyl-[acyl-carrier protein] dehydratase/trans-2-decenoyl-[acyl-carrier protein] isomerase
MRHAEFCARESFSRDELLGIAHGALVEDAPSPFLRLPAPPMLMVDRVTELVRAATRGRIVGEQDVKLDAWFFQCHFRGDPVQPGCLGVDAVWQLLGLFAAASGSRGTGRALGCKEVEFAGQIRPYNKVVRYEVEVARYTRLAGSGASIAIGSARVLVDGEHIYTVAGAKIGLFLDIAYDDYPNPSARSVGGIMDRMG